MTENRVSRPWLLLQIPAPDQEGKEKKFFVVSRSVRSGIGWSVASEWRRSHLSSSSSSLVPYPFPSRMNPSFFSSLLCIIFSPRMIYDGFSPPFFLLCSHGQETWDRFLRRGRATPDFGMRRKTKEGEKEEKEKQSGLLSFLFLPSFSSLSSQRPFHLFLSPNSITKWGKSWKSLFS